MEMAGTTRRDSETVQFYRGAVLHSRLATAHRTTPFGASSVHRCRTGSTSNRCSLLRLSCRGCTDIDYRAPTSEYRESFCGARLGPPMERTETDRTKWTRGGGLVTEGERSPPTACGWRARGGRGPMGKEPVWRDGRGDKRGYSRLSFSFFFFFSGSYPLPSALGNLFTHTPHHFYHAAHPCLWAPYQK